MLKIHPRWLTVGSLGSNKRETLHITLSPPSRIQKKKQPQIGKHVSGQVKKLFPTGSSTTVIRSQI